MALYRDAAGVPGQLLSSMAAPRPLVAGANELDVFDRPLPAGRYWLAIRTRPAVQLLTGGDERVTLCDRATTIPSLDYVWPDNWGPTRCQTYSPISVYLVTR